MSEVQESTCPLCSSAAKVEDHVMKKSRHYICSSCGELVVKYFAEDWLRKEAPHENKKGFSEAAKQCVNGDVYFISLSRQPDGSQRTSGQCLPLPAALVP